MEELIVSIFGKFTILFVPVVCGILSSFVIEAVNEVTPESVGDKLVNLVVSLLLGVLMIFVFPSIINGVPEIILFIILNFSFAIVFFKLGGKVAVESFVNGALKIIKKKTK